MIAIDIGGTFTDVFCLHDQQHLWLAKVPTTPLALVQGVRQGVAKVLALAGQPARAVEFVNIRTVHSALLPRPHLLLRVTPTHLEDARKGSRLAYFDEYPAYQETPVYTRAHKAKVGEMVWQQSRVF
jgi:Hydantoinase/oxoprolinase N-terminal region